MPGRTVLLSCPHNRQGRPPKQTSLPFPTLALVGRKALPRTLGSRGLGGSPKASVPRPGDKAPMAESTEKSLSPWAGACQSHVLSLGPALLGEGSGCRSPQGPGTHVLMVEFQAGGMRSRSHRFVFQTLCTWPGLLEGCRDRYTKRLFIVYLKFKFNWASVFHLATPQTSL